MKYDRPVWQIMHLCADAMPVVFRYDDVRAWFSDHYPDVNEATIRAHLIGLTEGGRAKHVQFAQRSPVFRRVARGEYAAIPVSERGEDPDVAAPSASRIKMSGNGAHRETPVGQGDPAPDDEAVSEPSVKEPTAKRKSDKPAEKPAGKTADQTADQSVSTKSRQQPSPTSTNPATAADAPPAAESVTDDDEEPEPCLPDVILLGSVGDRVNVPAPAKEVFREVPFQLSRLDAELAGCEWFVLSAEHGLVAPNEWISPDSRTLEEMDPDYRVVWASWVVARLQSLVGPIEGMLVRVDAPAAFVGPLFADLQEAGAVVASGTIPMYVPSTVAPHLEELVAEAEQDDQDEDEELATVHTLEPPSHISAHLADLAYAIPASKSMSLPETPGVYAWSVDPIGARELNRCLMLPVRAGLVFVGQVGGSSWQGLADPILNLRDHVTRIQLHGRARSSTFRMTLATVLRAHLGMTSLEDPRLTEWMLEHLSVTCWTSDELGELRDIEQRIIAELDPPLNVDHLPANAYRERLTQMRSALA